MKALVQTYSSQKLEFVPFEELFSEVEREGGPYAQHICKHPQKAVFGFSARWSVTTINLHTQKVQELILISYNDTVSKESGRRYLHLQSNPTPDTEPLSRNTNLNFSEKRFNRRQVFRVWRVVDGIPLVWMFTLIFGSLVVVVQAFSGSVCRPYRKWSQIQCRWKRTSQVRPLMMMKSVGVTIVVVTLRGRSTRTDVLDFRLGHTWIPTIPKFFRSVRSRQETMNNIGENILLLRRKFMPLNDIEK